MQEQGVHKMNSITAPTLLFPLSLLVRVYVFLCAIWMMPWKINHFTWQLSTFVSTFSRLKAIPGRNYGNFNVKNKNAD